MLFLGAGVFSSFIYAQNLPDSTDVRELLREGEQAADQGNYEHAFDLLNRADSLSFDIGYHKGNETATRLMADAYITRSEPEVAIELLAGLIEENPDSDDLSHHYNSLAQAHSLKGDHKKAIQMFEEAQKYLGRLPSNISERLSIGLLQNSAVAYRSLGQMNAALSNYLEAVEFANSRKDTAILIVLYNNLVTVYNDMEDPERAIYYLRRSLEMAETENSKSDILRARLNLGNALSNNEQYEEALENYELAEGLFLELRPQVPPAILLHNQGSTLAKMGRYEEGEKLMLESLELTEQMGILEGSYYNYLVLGSMYLDTGRLQESVRFLSNASSAAERIGNTEYKLNAVEKLNRAYSRLGDFEEAYRLLNEFNVLSDSLSDLEKERELADLKSQLELTRQSEINRLLEDKQVQQERRIQFQVIMIFSGGVIIALIIVLLFMMKKTSKEREEMLKTLKEQKTELEEVNSSKDKLFAIISHDLRSPLTSMQGILYMMKNNLISKDEVELMVNEMEGSIQKNLNVMEDLLVWAKEQLSGVEMNLKPIDLKKVTDDVVVGQEFVADKKGVKIIQKVPQNMTVLADLNALKMVMRNVVYNAIKFTDKGDIIEISTSENENTTQLLIKDSGIGIPEEAKDKIFDSKNWTREGTQNEKGTGFGLSISKDFLERMNGRIWFESEEGVGTSFFIELPKVQA
ncbi:tetratricopeptide repeat protein [Gracilimonas halophila]|uniref:histidine kinase n=2 Tax=Gracilimonas halophila TaxID=1834464 RepID=A0ABW5JKB9_9BACT